MIEYSKNQVRIASSLAKKALTMKELREELGLPMGELEKELASLIKLGVVEKEGFPTKYRVIKQVRDGLMEEQKNFKAKIIVEGQSKDKASLENAMKDLISKMDKDKLITVSDLQQEETIKNEEFFSTLFEATVSTKKFEDMMYMVLNYGPSSVELIEPKSATLERHELQGVLMDASTIIHTYVNMLTEMRLKNPPKDEINIV